MKRISALFVAVALASLLSACGGSKHTSAVKAKNASDPGKAGDSGSNAQGATTTTVKGAKGKTTSTTAKPGTSGPTTTTTTKPHVPVVMKLDKSCIRRGQAGDTQGLTVVSDDPDDIVAYSTEYSDHSNELTNKSYTTGSGYGRTDANGHLHLTWKVPDSATTGVATVHTIAEGKFGPNLTFKVVSQLESCP